MQHVRTSAPMLVLAGALASLAILLTPSAGAEVLPPAVTLGPITVGNGTATLDGSVGGTPDGNVTLSVNGQPLGVQNGSGQFGGTVDLGGQSALAITLRNPATGEVSTISIPLNSNVVGPGGVIPPQVLDALRSAGVSVTRPVDGFQVLDGLPLTIGGRVANREQLSSLKVNNKEVLGETRSDGTFSQSLPPSSREVTVTATDRQGVSQTSTFGVTPLSSVISTPAGKSVSAAGAQGLRIASVRYTTKGIRKSKRLRVVVTVKDRRGLLVRDARVTIRGVARTNFLTLKGRQAKLSGKTGQAVFSVRVNPRASGKRYVVATLASTRSARASLVTSVRLPKFAATAKRARTRSR